MWLFLAGGMIAIKIPCRESRDSPYLMVYTTGSRDKAEMVL